MYKLDKGRLLYYLTQWGPRRPPKAVYKLERQMTRQLPNSTTNYLAVNLTRLTSYTHMERGREKWENFVYSLI